MRQGTPCTVLNTFEEVLRVAAAVLEGVQRAIAEQTVENLVLCIVAGEIFTVCVAEVAG